MKLFIFNGITHLENVIVIARKGDTSKAKLGSCHLVIVEDGRRNCCMQFMEDGSRKKRMARTRMSLHEDVCFHH